MNILSIVQLIVTRVLNPGKSVKFAVPDWIHSFHCVGYLALTIAKKVCHGTQV